MIDPSEEEDDMADARRFPRWAKVSLVIVLALAALIHIGGGFVFANMIHSDALEPLPPTPDNGVYVLDAENDSITLTSSGEREDTVRPGVAGLAWEGGYGRIGDIVSREGLTVVREFALVDGEPPLTCTGELDSCDPVDIEGWTYRSDPSDVGLEFDEATYSSDLGEMGAWIVPSGDGSIWAIHVHGWRAGRREALRTLPIFSTLGITSMVVDYRNDEDAPADPSGLYRFGRTEWHDAEGAVEYAMAHGANEVVLVGYSTGAAIQMAFMENSDLATEVTAAVFDSPNVDMAESVRTEAARRTIPRTPIPIPSSLTWVAMTMADARWDIGWDQIAYVDRAGEIMTAPTLVFHGLEDDRVPVEVSRTLKENAPDAVQLIEVEAAGHVTSWNVDPEAYETALAAFLTREAGL
jgi:pimeloyl-ACP methyl ester carboxylesterase